MVGGDGLMGVMGAGELPDRGKRASQGTFSSSFYLFFQKLGRISVWVCGNYLTVL